MGGREGKGRKEGRREKEQSTVCPGPRSPCTHLSDPFSVYQTSSTGPPFSRRVETRRARQILHNSWRGKTALVVSSVVHSAKASHSVCAQAEYSCPFLPWPATGFSISCSSSSCLTELYAAPS